MKRASAVSYKQEEGVPRLLIKGRGHEAERIIEIAKASGIEVVEDSALAAMLDSGVKPGDFIPFWCWEATAKILAFVLSEEEKK
ncbi:MAG: EscU/YscU/HrcU family type III secretion system export apparatus switch protein [Treponema sp.]|nr:EscU/YscU/HrcU family type III secretion system export apparatus switch protein [Treponema sp.]